MQDFYNYGGYNQPNPYDEQQYRDRKKRFGWGALVFSALIFFMLGALTACLILPAFLNEQPQEPGGYPSTIPLPTPDGSGQIPEASLPTPAPTPAPTERPLPELGAKLPPIISSAQPAVDITQKVGPSVVGVIVKMNYVAQSGTSYEQDYGGGAGIVLTSDGYIVTNYHVVDTYDALYAVVNGQEYRAEVIGTDETMDLAVIKIDAAGLTPAYLGDSTTVQVGELAVAIGNPIDPDYSTVTQGIVSAVNREVNVDGQTNNYIQTDASINPGNSGGALINARGEVIGICALKNVIAGYDDYGNTIAAEGLGFAIPISDALPVIEQLIQHGRISRPGIGIMAYVITDVEADEWGTPVGVLISTVTIGGPAYEAGLKVDDIILQVEGKQVTAFTDLTDVIKSRREGDTISLRIWRGGEEMDVTVTIGDMNQINQYEREVLQQGNE